MIPSGLAEPKSFQREGSTHLAPLVAASIALAAAAGLLAGALASANRVLALPAILVVIVPFVAWRRMTLAVIGLAFLGLIVEQYRIGVHGGDLTDHIPLFTSLSDGFGVSGVYVNPMEILLAIVLLILLVRAGQRRTLLPRSALARSLAVLVGLVVAGAVHGVASGGDYKMALWEMRPFVYVAVMYLLAAQLPDSVKAVTALLWTFVIAVAIKSFQGLFLVMTAVLGGHQLGDYLLSHEDSVFFVLFLVLVVALWLFRYAGALRRVSTALMPIVLVVNLANNRRTSWLQLGACFLVLMVLVWIRLPDRRRLAMAVLATVAVAFAIYLPLYWNHSGLLAQPARAIQSTFAPSARDASSDLYRQVENANLEINLRRSPLIGVGYGIPINYVIPIVDLTRLDPFIRFIPHNNVLYIWMRLGAIGALAFWSFIGFVIVSACRLLRAQDLHLALYGSLVICAVIDYLIMGYLDLGLFWFRVAILMGCLLGVLEVATRVQKADELRAEVAGPNDGARVRPSSVEQVAAQAIQLAPVKTDGANGRAREWSRDGCWWWTGARWARAFTEDGLWRWDGSRWQPTADFVGKPPVDMAAVLSLLSEERYTNGGAFLAERRADWQGEPNLEQVVLQARRVAARLQRIEGMLGANGPGMHGAAPNTPERPRRGLELERTVLTARRRSLLIQIARGAPQPTVKEADDELDVARALEERAFSLTAALAEAEEAERVHSQAVEAGEAELLAAEQARSDAIERARKTLEVARSVPCLSANEVRARCLEAAMGPHLEGTEAQLDGLRLRSTHLETPATQLPLVRLRAHVGTARMLWAEHRQLLADMVLLESPEALRFLTALTNLDSLPFLLLVAPTGAVLRPCAAQEEAAARRFAALVDRRASEVELAHQRREPERRAAEWELDAMARRRSSIEAAVAELKKVEADPGLFAAIDAARLRLKRARADTETLLRARRRIQEQVARAQSPQPLSSPRN
jgi:O-Antigen ligase